MTSHSPVNVIVRMKDHFAPLYLTNHDNEKLGFSHLETEAEVMPHCCAITLLQKYYGEKFYEQFECVMYLPNVECAAQAENKRN